MIDALKNVLLNEGVRGMIEALTNTLTGRGSGMSLRHCCSLRHGGWWSPLQHRGLAKKSLRVHQGPGKTASKRKKYVSAYRFNPLHISDAFFHSI